MNKLLVICGPTGVGKTAVGLKIAKKFQGEILSADSRQVYRGMDIITGKDVPKNARIWLLDLVEPTAEFNVAQYSRVAWVEIKNIWQRGKLPILVGGTGLYIKAIVDGIETISIPRNEELRRLYGNKSAAELFEILAVLEATRAAKMNISDKKNPRRLLRAIEIAQFKGRVASMNRFIEAKPDVLLVGLTAPREKLYKRIDRRVGERLAAGAEEEIKRLIKMGVLWDSQAMTGIGYRQWREYFTGKAEKDEVTGKWKVAERQYARRQLIWFKRDKRIHWFDVDKARWEEKLEKLVKNWYSRAANVKDN